MFHTANIPLIFLLVAFFFIKTLSATEKPNVIFMMADDMGLGDTSAYQDFTGNSDEQQIHTPSMEKLANMGVRFTDAHSPATRCTTTRYALMTGRYCFRTRLKYWVLHGTQGDPLIEKDRPTLATMFKSKGYSTAMFGKWHIGLRYLQSNGMPAAGWHDADLIKGLHTSMNKYGFDVAKYTSRSHGTSGPDPVRDIEKCNDSKQTVGPGHIYGKQLLSVTQNGKALLNKGEHAYILTKLGERYSNNAIDYLDSHLSGSNANKPFFIYYPSHSNHTPYTPGKSIAGKLVAGASRSKSGQKMNVRSDYIYENDVALGRLLDYLETHNDPRNPGKKLIETTLVIFTSDNGAEIKAKTATGPFRSNKGSCYEGGHRVPFIISWPNAGIGNGNAQTNGQTNSSPIVLTDMFATFASIIGAELPNLSAGEKGAEDSYNILDNFKGEITDERPPIFTHDHKERRKDQAVIAMRTGKETVNSKTYPGQWKIFFKASLSRFGNPEAFELYNLSNDPKEQINLINRPKLKPLLNHLKQKAALYRNSGGVRFANIASKERIIWNWKDSDRTEHTSQGLSIKINALSKDNHPLKFRHHLNGLGVIGGQNHNVDSSEKIVISFNKDVIVESVAILADKGVCGGFYQVHNKSPLAIYCVDADNDSRNQHGNISDIGFLKAGEKLTLSSAPHFGVENKGDWRLQQIVVRKVKD